MDAPSARTLALEPTASPVVAAPRQADALAEAAGPALADSMAANRDESRHGTCDTPEGLDSALGQVAAGSLVGAPMQLQSGCGGEGPEHVFTWQAPEAGNYEFNTFGSDFDSVLYLLNSDACPARSMLCNDDDGGAQSRAETFLEAGQVVFVVVDTYAFETGNFILNAERRD